MTSVVELLVALTEVRAVKAHHAPARALLALQPERAVLKGPAGDHVWYVGASRRQQTGWWGPLTEEVATLAVRMFEAIRDRSPAEPAEWLKRIRLAFRHSHAGLGSCAAGAVELAIWDLLGHLHQRPVWRLLTDQPCPSDNARFYATVFTGGRTEVRAHGLATSLAETGWPLQKWEVNSEDTTSEAVHRVNSLCRQAPEGSIALELRPRWGTDDTVALISALPRTIAFCEEPLPPWRVGETKAIKLGIPLAAGEHVYDPSGFEALADYEVWQPDAVFIGGFTNFRVACGIAQCGGKACLPHGGGLIPAVHAATSGTRIHLIEWHLGLEPWRQSHLQTPLSPSDDRRLPIPEQPGWAGALKAEA